MKVRYEIPKSLPRAHQIRSRNPRPENGQGEILFQPFKALHGVAQKWCFYHKIVDLSCGKSGSTMGSLLNFG